MNVPAPTAAPEQPAWVTTWQRVGPLLGMTLVLAACVASLGYVAYRLDHKESTTPLYVRACVGRHDTLCCPAIGTCCRPSRDFNLTSAWEPVLAYECRINGQCDRLRPHPTRDCHPVTEQWIGGVIGLTLLSFVAVVFWGATCCDCTEPPQ